MKQKLKGFKSKLENYFITDKENEWVDVEVININRLDIIIVTKKDGNIDEFREIINNSIGKINNLSEKKSEKLYLGHLDINTVEEAELFDISKPIRRKNNQVSFADMVDMKNNTDEICEEEEEKINNSRIISFYSYKGGVGRTVALIQTAYLLAKSGKRVLMMDLDIEAPSFYNIFKDIIKTDQGLVDYLYEKMYLDNDISLKDIITKINLNLKGEIYLISAGVNDFKYVKRLDMLKEKRIYENKLIQKLIKESEKAYDVDYTLIDSRTGINRWGALSLIDIADEVILFAYPNRENIEGLKLIIELIEDCKKLTIALSRIDQSSQGAKVAKQLFENLNINQEYIPIYYESGIALAEKYPIEEHLKPYETISDFILEEENNRMTLEYINNNEENTKAVLENVKVANFQDVVTSRERKIAERSNWIIIKNEEDKLNFSYIFEDELKGSILIHDLNKNEVTRDVKEFLRNHESQNTNIEYITSMIMSYIIKIIDDHSELKNLGIKRINELDDTRYQSYVEYFREIIYFKELYSVISDYLEDIDGEVYRKINIILNFEDMLELFEGHIKDDKSIESLLKSILEIVIAINMESSICLKLILNNKDYKEYKMIINKYNANILDLAWDNLEEDDAIQDIKEVFENTINHISDNLLGNIYNNLIKEERYSKLSEIGNDLLLDMFATQGSHKEVFKFYKIKYKKEFSNVVYGKRTDPDMYSKLLSQWIYEELKEDKLLNKKQIFSLLRYASEIELESTNENKKSFIDFLSFKEAMNKILVQ